MKNKNEANKIRLLLEPAAIARLESGIDSCLRTKFIVLQFSSSSSFDNKNHEKFYHCTGSKEKKKFNYSLTTAVHNFPFYLFVLELVPFVFSKRNSLKYTEIFSPYHLYQLYMYTSESRILWANHWMQIFSSQPIWLRHNRECVHLLFFL